MPRHNDGIPKNIDNIIGELEELVEKGTTIAFTSKVLIDVDDLKHIIEDLNLNIPEEVKQARAIVVDRMEILSAAKKDGEKIIAKAKEQAARLVEEHEIMQTAKAQANDLLSKAKAQANLTVATAQEKADEIINEAKAYSDDTTAQADRWSKEMRTAASDFVDSVMRESEEVFTKGLKDIKRVRANLAAAGVHGSDSEKNQ